MKKIYLFAFLICFFYGNLNSQVPENFNYQAVVRDDGGNLVSDQSVSIRLSILQGSITGSTVYSETHNPTTNQFGLVTLEIGNGTVITGTFSTIAWNTGPYFIKIELDPSGGSSYTEMGTSQILSVPYATYAKTAEEYTESDPVFGAHASNGITGSDLTNWNSAFGWGDHSLAGYLTSFTETDPVFSAHASNGITGIDLTNWNSAFGWGDHSTAGYLTSFTETDPVFGAHAANGITGSDLANWNSAFGWGDHSLAGYLTGYTETDPLFNAHAASIISANDINFWNDAYDWGDHATAGYLTGYTETDPLFNAHPASIISANDINFWNDAYDWGNHATAGYGLLAAPNTWTENQIISHPGSPRLIIQDLSSMQSFVEFRDASQTMGYIVLTHANHNLYIANQSSGPLFEWVFSGDGKLITPGDIESAGIIYDPGGNSNQWNTAFSWGDHSMTGYLTSGSTLEGLVQSTATGNSFFTGGNLGIGTSTPMELLHVAGNLRVDNYTYLMGPLMASDISAAGTGDFLNLTVANGLTAQVGSIDELHSSNFIHTSNAIIDASLDVGGSTFTVAAGGNLVYDMDVLVANTAGNVGVGTASPAEKLHVAGNLRVDNNTYLMGPLMASDISAAGTGDFLNLTVANGLTAQVGSIDELHSSNFIHTSNAIIDASLDVGGSTFTVAAGGNLVYDMDVLVANTAGNVGIGTTSPAQKLSVNGIVQSVSGGFMFPDATVQQTAAPVIKHGSATVGVSIGGYNFYNISIPFGYSFSAPPTVTVTGSNAPGNPITRIIPSVYNVSPSQFLLVLYNSYGSGTSGSYTLNWIAVGN